jgi:hypothetical protein
MCFKALKVQQTCARKAEAVRMLEETKAMAVVCVMEAHSTDPQVMEAASKILFLAIEWVDAHDSAASDGFRHVLATSKAMTFLLAAMQTFPDVLCVAGCSIVCRLAGNRRGVEPYAGEAVRANLIIQANGLEIVMGCLTKCPLGSAISTNWGMHALHYLLKQAAQEIRAPYESDAISMAVAALQRHGLHYVNVADACLKVIIAITLGHLKCNSEAAESKDAVDGIPHIREAMLAGVIQATAAILEAHPSNSQVQTGAGLLKHQFLATMRVDEAACLYGINEQGRPMACTLDGLSIRQAALFYEQVLTFGDLSGDFYAARIAQRPSLEAFRVCKWMRPSLNRPAEGGESEPCWLRTLGSSDPRTYLPLCALIPRTDRCMHVCTSGA